MKTNDFIYRVAAIFFRAIVPAFTLAMQPLGLAQPDPNWKVHDWQRPRPPIIESGTASTPEQPGKPPSDAIVLFDGKDLGNWVSLDGSPPKWIVKDSHLECVKGSGYIRTLQNFGDCQLHVEWAAPVPPQGQSQGRGNSGVFLMGLYEVQVLDSYENITYADGQAGAAYGQYPPLVNAARPPGQWQTYDIIFTRPRFDEQGRVKSPARMTVLHNGVLIQNNVTLTGPTAWMKRDPYVAHPDKLPLSLQDHGNPVRYRNIWLRELSAAGSKELSLSTEVLDRYAGTYQLDSDTKIVVSRQGNQLNARVVNLTREHSHVLIAESETSFVFKSVDARLKFHTDALGAADSATFIIATEERPVKKVTQ